MPKTTHSNNVNSFIARFALISSAFAIFVILLGNAMYVPAERSSTASVTGTPADVITVVIDPGHGGEDGGAIAADGTVEKDLNLEFGRTLDSLLGLMGIEAVLTRDSDTLLYDKYSDLDDYTGKKKVYDLKNRLRFTEEYGDNAIFVGVHMNKFSDPKYSGTQVYYSPNSADSITLANLLQEKVRMLLQSENNRQIKKAGSSIFLLKQLQIPAVLAECGFLSNEAETAKLNSSEYKKEFSLTAAAAIGEFINSRNS